MLSETAKTALQAAQAFRHAIKAGGIDAHAARVSFMHDEAAWLKRFFDQESDESRLEEIRDLPALVRAQAARDGKGVR